MEISHAIAVKAFIIKDNQLLLIKRRSNDVHKPGEWDIPGGRLSKGENPFNGVKRETLEEVGLSVEPVIPIAINHFTRDDGQIITMIIFGCRITSGEITLSEEHTESQWTVLADDTSRLPSWVQPIARDYLRYFNHTEI